MIHHHQKGFMVGFETETELPIVLDNAEQTGYSIHSSKMGSGMHSNASKCPCMEMPCCCERGEGVGYGMSGGSGFARGTHMDTGFDRTIGAGMGSKTYRKKGCGTGSMPPPENENEYPLVASGRFSVKPIPNAPPLERKVGGKKKGMGFKEIQDDLKKFDFNRIKDYVGLAKPKKGMGFDEVRSDLRKFDFNRIKDYVGLAKPPKDLQNAVGKMLNMKQREQLLDVKPKVVERNQMQAIRGAGRSTRNEIVKKIMKEKGMKMIEASSYVKKHNLYKK
jgi:hypothetical protein